jgi:hypothetical protein
MHKSVGVPGRGQSYILRFRRALGSSVSRPIARLRNLDPVFYSRSGAHGRLRHRDLRVCAPLGEVAGVRRCLCGYFIGMKA